jgi:hypothetical protein
MLINLKDLTLAYINLESYPNRDQTMVNMLDNFGLNYFRVAGQEADDYDGIAAAHFEAVAAGADIVLEDDCLPANYRETFEVPDDADVVYLGISTGTTNLVTPKYEKLSDDIYKLNDMTSAHAIMYITDAGKQWLTNARDLGAQENIGFDLALAKLMTTINVYGLNSPLWYQHHAPEQTNMTLDEALLLDEYSGGGYPDYPEPLIERFVL